MKKKYYAFISYSHVDKKWANWLHKSLERYTIPKDVRRKFSNKLNLPNRLYPIFKDDEELSTAPDLSKSIVKALSQSEFLIVICSPSATKTRWVNHEIQTFKKISDESKIFCMIIDGEPKAHLDPTIDSSLKCFPEAILSIYNLSNDSAHTKVPLAADVRPGMDEKREALLKIISGMMGLDFDVLYRRDAKRQRIRNFLLGSIVAFVVVTIFTVWKVQDIRRINLLSNQVILSGTENARRSLQNGRPFEGLRSLKQVFNIGTDNKKARYYAESLLGSRKIESFLGRIDCFSSKGGFIGTLDNSVSGNQSLGYINEDNLKLSEIIVDYRGDLSTVSCNDVTDTVYMDGVVYTDSSEWNIPEDGLQGFTMEAELNLDGSWLGIRQSDCSVSFIDTNSKRIDAKFTYPLYKAELEENSNKYTECLKGNIAFSSTGNIVSISSNDQTILYHLDSKKELFRISHASWSDAVPTNAISHLIKFDSSGKIVSLPYDNKNELLIVDVESSQIKANIPHDSPVIALTFHAEGTFISTLTQNGTVRTINWKEEEAMDVTTPFQLSNFQANSDSGIISIYGVPVVVVFNGDILQAIDLVKNKILYRNVIERKMSGGGFTSIESLLVNSEGLLIVQGTWDTNIIDLSPLLKLPINDENYSIYQSNSQRQPITNSGKDDAEHETVNNSEKYLYRVHSYDDTDLEEHNFEGIGITIYDIVDNSEIAKISTADYITTTEIEPNGDKFTVASNYFGTQYASGEIQGLNLNSTGKSQLELLFELPRNWVGGASYVTNLRSYLYWSDEKKGVAALIRPGDETPYRYFQHSEISNAVVDSVNNFLITISNSNRDIKLWHLNDGELLSSWGVGFEDIESSQIQDGKYFATVSKNGQKKWAIGIDERKSKLIYHDIIKVLGERQQN